MADPFFIPTLLVGLLPGAAIFIGQRMAREESNEQIAQIREESRILENQIIEFLADGGTLASKSQLASLKRKGSEYVAALGTQKQSRLELEERLKTAQADVIARESAHQDVKSQKQEDEVALQSVLSSYSDVSSESVSLERRLAESLKSIDKLTAEVALTEDQKAVFEALGNALTNASAQLRDVIVAHQNIYERLEGLRSQYNDLEGEYIKLVEMQLGA